MLTKVYVDKDLLDVDEAENPGSRPTKQPTKSRR
jgi:hypothetical protein